MRKRTKRRKLSMTSLIDVIFLLLLFFMLSSTFTKFAEVELMAAGAGGASAGTSDKRPFFLRLGEDQLDVNGRPLEMDSLATGFGEEDAPVILVALQAEVTSQRLTDLLVALRAIPGASVTVLERAS